MVSYDPLWNTMQKKGITTYTLIEKYKIRSKTIYNLKHGKNITTARLGHRQVSTTQDIYAHIMEKSNREASNKIEELFF